MFLALSTEEKKNMLAEMVTKRYKDFFWVLFFRAEAEFIYVPYYFVEVSGNNLESTQT
jgi:hypothetical protein